MALREGLIFGSGNPLLDISCKVELEFLEKYNLKSNSAILGDDSHLQIYEDIKKNHNSEIEYIPGGSCQNSLRTASWILKYPNAATFVGCIGRDHNADIMKEKAKEVGLYTAYQVTDKASTGTCAVLITGNDRSMVAHLAAANLFTSDHMDNPEIWSLVEKAKIIYTTGFFFTVSPDSIMKLARFALENDRPFSINLSAPFISMFYGDKLKEALPYVDIIFGNDDEAMTFSKSILGKESTNIEEIAKEISNLPKLNDKKRVVIITQADKPVIYVVGDKVMQIPVPPIEAEKIIDTNGAGDAFVGGFLAQFVQDKDIEKCIDCGVWASGLIIQRSGCTFPNEMTYQ
ncbi:unnamed protein product [Brachionus calyciflorus]|uniref:Adenosine kinase n=1 Tax=Brachionus calyciflorus TaxID=104777 RepID=A0A814BUX6_9BILA|nr:unnamed protein product [Brachionus calyciflorus]